MNRIIPQNNLLARLYRLFKKSIIVLTLLVGLTSVVAQTAFAQDYSPAPEYSDYIVQPGDSIAKIATAYGTSIEFLIEINYLADPSLISVGQTLKIPYQAPPPAPVADPNQQAWPQNYPDINAQVAQVAGSLPPCPPELHDKNVWHGLVNHEWGCHYDHEHKDNPHAVNDIFGPVSVAIGQEISYPWQTVGAHGAENEHKHGGYGWLVRRDMPCLENGTGGCITDFRAQYHAIMAPAGATTRVHSFWMEARACRTDNPTQCGILRTGGWLDYGVLLVDGVHVPLPVDPPGGPFPAEHRPARLHCVENSHTCGASHGIWYSEQYNPETGEPGAVLPQLAIATDDAWSKINPWNPSEFVPFCENGQCRFNNSVMEAHLLSFYLPLQLDTDEDGIINLNAFTDQWGKIAPDCVAAGPACIPIQVQNLPLGHYQYRDDSHGYQPTDHDVSPEGEFWIKFPN